MTWFLLKDEEIRGPFETARVLEICDDQSLIWGPGMSEWTDQKSWKTFLNKPKKIIKKVTKKEIAAPRTPVIDTENKTVEEMAVLALHQFNDKWFFAHKGQRFGPFNQNHLILKICNLEEVEKVLLWKKGEAEWRLIFEFPKILKALNQKIEETKAA